ncbi:hypothetical protein RFI_28191, partial [Reticulomyxa filosa]
KKKKQKQKCIFVCRLPYIPQFSLNSCNTGDEQVIATIQHACSYLKRYQGREVELAIFYGVGLTWGENHHANSSPWCVIVHFETQHLAQPPSDPTIDNSNRMPDLEPDECEDKEKNNKCDDGLEWTEIKSKEANADNKTIKSNISPAPHENCQGDWSDDCEKYEGKIDATEKKNDDAEAFSKAVTKYVDFGFKKSYIEWALNEDKRYIDDLNTGVLFLLENQQYYQSLTANGHKKPNPSHPSNYNTSSNTAQKKKPHNDNHDSEKDDNNSTNHAAKTCKNKTKAKKSRKKRKLENTDESASPRKKICHRSLNGA